MLAGGCRLATEQAPPTPRPAQADAHQLVLRLPSPSLDGPGIAPIRSDNASPQPGGIETANDARAIGQGTIRLVQGVSSRGEEPIPPPQLAAPVAGLTLPKNLPGADAPPIAIPSDASQQQRTKLIDRLFPPLPGFRPPERFEPLPDGRALALDDLQAVVRENSPLLRQARADVLTARGRAINAGAYPNPQLGYEMDTVGTLGTAGYQGGMWNQTIKTAGKLGLARSAARMDVRNAELALRKARIDLATNVQAGYFAVLVAQQWVEVSHALVKFTDEVYRVQVDRLRAGDAAAYEPAQLRVLAVQARAAEVRARNRQIAAWRSLPRLWACPRCSPRPWRAARKCRFQQCPTTPCCRTSWQRIRTC